MNFFELIFGKDLTSVISTLIGYLASALIAYIATVVPGVTGGSTLLQVVTAVLALLVAGLGRVVNTKV
jgi:hypothetical protein